MASSLRHSFHTALVASIVSASACALISARAVAQSASSTSAPVGAASVAQVTAKVVAIDPDNNSVTIRGPQGRQLAIDVDPAVGDVKKLQVGDDVHIRYRGALLLSADKADSKGIRSRIENTATTPDASGVSAQVKSVDIVATVQKIDRKRHQITLRGTDNTVVLQVGPDVSLANLKVGDSVRASYAAATAVEITRNGQPVQ